MAVAAACEADALHHPPLSAMSDLNDISFFLRQ